MANCSTQPKEKGSRFFLQPIGIYVTNKTSELGASQSSYSQRQAGRVFSARSLPWFAPSIAPCHGAMWRSACPPPANRPLDARCPKLTQRSHPPTSVSIPGRAVRQTSRCRWSSGCTGRGTFTWYWWKVRYEHPNLLRKRRWRHEVSSKITCYSCTHLSQSGTEEALHGHNESSLHSRIRRHRRSPL
jgi:hypothetical protein